MFTRVMLIWAILFTGLYSQQYEARIVKIHSTNIFELSTGELVSIYGLNIPTLDDTAIVPLSLIKNIAQFEKDVMLKGTYIVERTATGTNEVEKVYLIRNYMFGKEDIARRLLRQGFAKLTKNVQRKDNTEMLHQQELAIADIIGIWAYHTEELTDRQPYSEMLPQKYRVTPVYYERPLLPLLGLSAAAFFMSYKNFAEAGDGGNKAFTANIFSNTWDQGVGVLWFVGGIATTYIALKRVEVSANTSQVDVKYRF